MPITSSRILKHPTDVPATDDHGPFAEPEDEPQPEPQPEPPPPTPCCVPPPLMPSFPLLPPLKEEPPLRVLDVATVMLGSFALGAALTGLWAWSISKRPVAACLA